MNIPEYEDYHENKSHGDPLFPYNTYLCTIPLDFQDVPLHWHNEMEIIYIKKGRGLVSIDFHSSIVSSNDIIIVKPGQLHGISQLDSYSMEYENIIFSIDMLVSKHVDSIYNEFFVPFLSGNIGFPCIIHQTDLIHNSLSQCLNKADTICSSFEKGYKLALKSYLYEFFYILYKYSDSQTSQTKHKNIDKVKNIIKYIETNYQHSITIEEIANISGFSASHFMKFFKKTMGTSFIDYINDYRLSMASRILISSDDTIINIAADCGFDNLSYFNRMFKRRFGITPSQYRNSNLNT